MTITTRTDIDRMAQHVVGIIREIQEAGELPADVTDFGQLHDHFDANVGWSDEIDALPHMQWAAVQDRVTELLSASLQWKPIRNGFSATAGDRTYYVGRFHDDLFASFRDGDRMELTSINWGQIADMDAAKAIAQAHANQN